MSTGTEERKVIDMTVEELRWLIEDAVSVMLMEWFRDPDEELDLRPGFVHILEERQRDFAAESDTMTLEEAFARIESD